MVYIKCRTYIHLFIHSPSLKNKTMLNLIVEKILNTLFPEHCIGCNLEGELLCEKCILKIPPPKPNECAIKITSVFCYKNDTTKKAIHFLKYKNKKGLGKIFARSLHDIILEELVEQKTFSNFSNPILVPIPLSKKKLKERGFNQSEIIAREMSLIDNGELLTLSTDILYKTKDTMSQASIKNRSKRMQNLKGCFSTKRQHLIKNKNIILIDDVTTTGATINEAGKILLKAGAKKIIAFTVAH